jgi:hypothetical protein
LSPDEKKSEPRIHGKMNKNRKTKEADFDEKLFEQKL